MQLEMFPIINSINLGPFDLPTAIESSSCRGGYCCTDAAAAADWLTQQSGSKADSQ